MSHPIDRGRSPFMRRSCRRHPPRVLAGGWDQKRSQQRRVGSSLDTRVGVITCMPAVKGRKHRSGVSGAVSTRVRLDPAQKEKAELAATALGISMTTYIEALIARDAVDERGRPVWWTDPAPGDQEELPLKTA